MKCLDLDFRQNYVYNLENFATEFMKNKEFLVLKELYLYFNHFDIYQIDYLYRNLLSKTILRKLESFEIIIA